MPANTPARIAQRRNRAFKRGMDIVGALLCLLFLAPLLIGIALLVAVGSGRPVLHREQRVGRNSQPFTLLKFRTLKPGNESQSSVAPEDDPRITRVGLPLRRSRLDELPQLLNVLAGDMSLVGPRPMPARHLEMLDCALREQLLSVRPGVTGPASILYFAEDAVLTGRPDAEAVYLRVLLPAKSRVQQDYLRQWRPGLDIYIIFQTLARVWSPQAWDDSARRVRALLTEAGEPC